MLRSPSELPGDTLRKMAVLVAMAAVLAAACKRQVPMTSPPPESTPTRDSGPAGQDPEPAEMTIVGTLRPTVERGGWILDTTEGEFLLLQLTAFTDRPWFKDGNRLRARGRVDREILTTFMQGTPFLVKELGPADQPIGNDRGANSNEYDSATESRSGAPGPLRLETGGRK